jgi:branched-chain amino acid transport system permease protein
MTGSAKTAVTYAVIAGAGLLGPLLLPAYTTQFSFLWVMVTFALTWDVLLSSRSSGSW